MGSDPEAAGFIITQIAVVRILIDFYRQKLFMELRKSLFVLISSVLLLSCTQLSETRTLALAHGLPTSHPVHQGIVSLQKSLYEKSRGKLQIKIYADGQLGSERETLELLQIGSVDMTKVSSATMSNFVPDYSVLNIPYIFRDKQHVFRTLEGDIGRELLDKGADFWLKGLCFYDAGSRSFYTKSKPIQKPEDLVSLKIRTMNDPTAVKMVRALGGAPTPMSFGELYSALQQGVVDGAENNPPSFVTSRHFEICKYYTLDEHTYTPDILIIGTKTWSRLSVMEKQWLREAAKVSVQAQRKYWAASVAESFRVLKKNGVQVYTPDKTMFVEKSKSVIESFSEPSLKRLIKRIKEN